MRPGRLRRDQDRILPTPRAGALFSALPEADLALAARDEAAPGLPLEVHTIGIRGGIARKLMLAKVEAVS